MERIYFSSFLSVLEKSEVLKIVGGAVGTLQNLYDTYTSEKGFDMKIMQQHLSIRIRFAVHETIRYFEAL